MLKANISSKTIIFAFALFITAWLQLTVPNNVFSKNRVRSNLEEATPSATSVLTPTPETSWLVLPTLPPSATQADVGAEIYRFVCQDCHGDKGQGLTDEWRTEWAPSDQNCWQSKCHAPNHPPEGFILPHYIPAIIGPTKLTQFETALDLHEYISVKMPWHTPGSLIEAEYWQLTAFLVRENNIDPIDAILDRSRAATLQLHPDNNQLAPTPVSTVVSVPTTQGNPNVWWPIILFGIIPFLAIFYWIRKRRYS